MSDCPMAGTVLDGVLKLARTCLHHCVHQADACPDESSALALPLGVFHAAMPSRVHATMTWCSGVCKCQKPRCSQFVVPQPCVHPGICDPFGPASGQAWRFCSTVGGQWCCICVPCQAAALLAWPGLRRPKQRKKECANKNHGQERERSCGLQACVTSHVPALEAASRPQLWSCAIRVRALLS